VEELELLPTSFPVNLPVTSVISWNIRAWILAYIILQIYSVNKVYYSNGAKNV